MSNGFPPSGQWGTEFYTYHLARGLAARGCEVSVLYPVRDGSRSRYELVRAERYGVALYELHNAGDPLKRFADSYRNDEIERVFASLVRELEPDVVHFTHMVWGLSVRLPAVARSLGVATVATVTDYGLVCHRGQFIDSRLRDCDGPRDAKTCARCIREPGRFDARPVPRTAKRLAVRGLSAAGGLGVVVRESDVAARQREVRSTLESLDHVIAPTRRMADVLGSAGVAADRLTTLSYGFEEAPYRAAPSRAPDGEIHFGFLGQFLPHKGLHRLFEAVRIMLHRLPESVEPWRVRLFGNPVGGRHRRYFNSIWSAELAERVVLEGPFEPLSGPAVFASLDAIVLPSQWDENAPLTVLQARATGIPVVASDVPGVREVLVDGEHGRLVPPGDALALADAMRRTLLEGPARNPESTVPVPFDAHMDRVRSIHASVAAGARRRSAPGAPGRPGSRLGNALPEVLAGGGVA